MGLLLWRLLWYRLSGDSLTISVRHRICEIIAGLFVGKEPARGPRRSYICTQSQGPRRSCYPHVTEKEFAVITDATQRRNDEWSWLSPWRCHICSRRHIMHSASHRTVSFVPVDSLSSDIRDKHGCSEKGMKLSDSKSPVSTS
jgi:hypothetical protein